jgi:hypothetical protein
MKLTFAERSNLGAILPIEGNWMTITAIRELQNVIMPTDEDLKEIDGSIDPNTGAIRYNVSKDVEKEFIITAWQVSVVKSALEKLEQAGKLRIGFISLYEKFVVKG